MSRTWGKHVVVEGSLEYLVVSLIDGSVVGLHDRCHCWRVLGRFSRVFFCDWVTVAQWR
ncbi:hypothetical protein HMPREF9607_00341 [Cutibacterium modestum HL044PA1]|uniref:Uncharacterized protein n=1 Tax=Cutibacterium modestum HL044PA1 TaxID=765109 RepID=A0ABP2K938_9ACTN|nr:hypothetical protein HMPREF9607_00341 [Cutibacterium modestum HL044PA1]